VRLIGHHTGISLGFYGTSHHATETSRRCARIADLAVVSPADGAQLEAAIRASADYDRRSISASARTRPCRLHSSVSFAFGKAHEHLIGEELTSSPAVWRSMRARSRNGDECGRPIGRRDRHGSIKPIDRDAI